MTTRTDALIIHGGWEGHEPGQFAEHYADVLRREGLSVDVAGSLDALLDAERLQGLSVIVPIWSMGEIGDAPLRALLDAVAGGVGIAGFHGGMADAFRGALEYHWMVGGQFVSHPDGIKDYTVTISDREHPVTEGLEDFAVHSEQYYMHVDPSNHVLASTVFDPESAPWVRGCEMPVAWTRMWGEGRVFYSSLGHATAELAVPEMAELQRRGILWAAR